MSDQGGENGGTSTAHGHLSCLAKILKQESYSISEFSAKRRLGLVPLCYCATQLSDRPPFSTEYTTSYLGRCCRIGICQAGPNGLGALYHSPTFQSLHRRREDRVVDVCRMFKNKRKQINTYISVHENVYACLSTASPPAPLSHSTSFCFGCRVTPRDAAQRAFAEKMSRSV